MSNSTTLTINTSIDYVECPKCQTIWTGEITTCPKCLDDAADRETFDTVRALRES